MLRTSYSLVDEIWGHVITTSYTYDALNRTLTTTYPSGTPNVTYTFDGSGVTNGVGHLTSISAANGTTTKYTAFDTVGHIAASTQITASSSYSFTYAYNLAGSLNYEVYPSGRAITETYDAANRPSTLTGTLSGAQTQYITQTAYWPHALQYFVRGNTLRYAVGYNSRLQPTETYEAINNTNSVSTMLEYSCLNWGTSRNFGSSLYGLCPVLNNTNDNGTLQGVSYSNGGSGYSSYLTFSQSFTYDKVNRLASASDTGGWSRNFAYDSYGNMWVSGSSGIPLAGNTPTSNVYSAANRISGSSYDASGNQLAVNGDTATYDAENRLTTVTEPPSMGGGTESLVYDGDGKRVQKVLPSGTTNYVYDAFGRLVAEYTTNPTEAPCWTCYLTYDHLGSVRMVTSGNLQFVARHDFVPFGEELPPNSAGRNGQWGPGTDNVTQKFTGQIRDEETDLDYFNARYFGAALGRFTSPDPANAGADPMNPQSWNAYAYAFGNPLANTDTGGTDSTNYAGFQQGFCPASLASCPIAGQPTVGTPTVPNEINLAEVSYTNNVRSMFGWVAGDNPSQIMAYAAAHPAGPDLKAIAKTFNATAAHLPLDAGTSYQVPFQVRGTTYNIQIVVPNSPGQMVSFSSLNDASTGIVDPLTGFHGGNSSEYFGDDAFDVLHIADVSEPYGDVKQGLDAHIDQFNPIANPATFLLHFIVETVPFYFNPSGQHGIVTCFVGGGCH